MPLFKISELQKNPFGKSQRRRMCCTEEQAASSLLNLDGKGMPGRRCPPTMLLSSSNDYTKSLF